MFSQIKGYSCPIKVSSKPMNLVEYKLAIEWLNRSKLVNEGSNHSQEGIFLVAPRGGRENLSLDEVF